MFHPVGSQPPGVYWRRRLALIGTVLVVLILLAVTVKVLFGGSGATPAGQAPPTDLSTSHPSTSRTSTGRPTSHPAPPGGAGHSSSTLRSTPSGSAAHRTSSPTTSDGPPGPCPLSQLAVRAVSDKTSYPIGATPKLMLQVTNTGAAPCVQDLADRQIELLVFNGASRVWGSHDCKVLPGTDDMTLVPDAAVRITVVWSGLSSQPGCAGTRQLVGAGTYTLYAKLSGKTGTASQFAIH